jgi:hypothetical protein
VYIKKDHSLGWPGHKYEILSQKRTKSKRTSGIAEVVEYLPRKHKTLNSNSSIHKKKKKIITSVAEDVEKLEPSYRNVKWYSSFGKQFNSSSKKVKHRVPVWNSSSIYTCRCIPRGKK